MGSSGHVVTKVVAGVAALGCVGLAVAAFRYSRGRSRESDALREANRVMVPLAKGMAKCALNGMPATGAAIPSHLSEVSGKSFASRPNDWKESAFACTELVFDEPQLLQYQWLKESETRGRVFAVADLNADHIPDKWFEVAIVCEQRGKCAAPNYISEVLEDGVREPPAILRWVGRAQRELGEPPSLTPDDLDASAKSADSAASATAAAPNLPAFPPPGSGAPLDQIYFDAERLAIRKMPGAQLVSFEAKGLLGHTVEPGPSSSVEALYGLPDRKGIVAKGEPVLSVSFGPSGLSDHAQKASRELHVLISPECSPEKAWDALPGSVALSLFWDATRERSLWLGRTDKAKTTQLSAATCARVR